MASRGLGRPSGLFEVIILGRAETLEGHHQRTTAEHDRQGDHEHHHDVHEDGPGAGDERVARGKVHHDLEEDGTGHTGDAPGGATAWVVDAVLPDDGQLDLEGLDDVEEHVHGDSLWLGAGWRLLND